MSFKLLIIGLLFALVSPAASALAAENDVSSGAGCTKPVSTPLPTSISFDALMAKFKSLDGPDAHVLDAYFMFDVRSKAQALDINAQTYNTKLDPNGTKKALATALYNAWKSPTKGGPDPQNTQQYLALIASQAGNLDLQSKFLLLSQIGAGLDDCYTHSNAPYSGTPPDTIFNSLRAGTHQCGVCRDAHTYMANVAKALGFVDTGTHTVNWNSDGSTGSHDIMQMKDPKTGIYYVQNWGDTFNTNQKTLTQAVDVSAAVMGQITGSSLVESKPGTVHVYQPLVTRWARQTIEDAAKLGADRSMLTLHIGNKEQAFRFELGSENTKVFALHDNYETSNGPYTLDAVGVAGQISGKKEFQSKWLSEAGYAGNIYGGALRINAPYLGTYNAGSGTSAASVTGFAGFNISGYARWNDFTGKLELHGDMMDFKPKDMIGGQIEFQLPPNNALKASMTWAPKGTPFKVEATRAWQLSVNTATGEQPILRTDYDKLNLVIDTRNGANQPYVVSSTGVYLFEGVEKTAAIGIKEHFKAVIPSEKLGEFYVVFDASAIVANASQDPFYEAPLALTFGTGWTRKIYKALNVGVDLSASTSQRPFYLFEEPGTVTPELGKTDGANIIGNVWLGGKF